MGAKQILIDARKLIEAPERWTQHTYAKTKNGLEVSSRDRRAVCWCSAGAYNKVTEDMDYSSPKALLAWDALVSATGIVTKFNDTHTHAEVLAAFDKAIEMAVQP